MTRLLFIRFYGVAYKIMCNMPLLNREKCPPSGSISQIMYNGAILLCMYLSVCLVQTASSMQQNTFLCVIICGWSKYLSKTFHFFRVTHTIYCYSQTIEVSIQKTQQVQGKHRGTNLRK